MTMMISKFNKLIQNKLIWIAFIILIVFAFVVWDMAIPGNAEDAASRQAAGHLYGEPVSAETLRSAWVHTYLAFTLAVGRQMPVTPELDAELNKMAWRRIVSLHVAREMGIKTTPPEIISAIQTYAPFQQDNQFRPEIYRAFQQQFLAPMGFSGKQFEDHVRQEITLQKLQRVVAGQALISPSEINLAVHTLGDEFTVEYAFINQSVLGEGTTVTDEEVAAYFSKDPAAFTIPQKVRVNFVRFDVNNFLDQVEITEEQARSYYDLNTDEFTYTEDPVKAEKAEGEEEDEAKAFPVAKLKPFEEVQEEITQQLRRQEAMRMASDRAMDFVIQLVPDRQGHAKSFQEAAAEYERTIETTGLFAATEVPDQIDAGPAFVEAAFNLRPNPNDSFSDAVVGERYVYVMSLDTRQAPYVPELEEVIDQVREAALADAVERAVKDLANAFREAEIRGLKEGKSFSKIAEDFALKLHPPVTFTVSAGLEGIPGGDDIVRSVLTYNQGEVTEPEETEDGYIVAYVAKRVPADVSQFTTLRAPIVQSLARERGRILFEEWQEQMLRDANFTARVVEQPPPDEDEEDY